MLKLIQQNLLAILEWSLTKTSTSADIYLQSAVHVFTTSGICGIFAVTLIWRVQNYLQVLWCLAILINVIQFCLGLQKLTSPSSNIFWTVARVVTNSPPFTCSIPLLRSLHWLSIKYRVHFKICLLTYKALHEEQPVYLHSLIATSLPSRSLRSNRGITLSIPRIRTNTGARAFSSCAPSLWNNLPLSVHSATSVVTFRRRLKTYLFELAFPL